ncbi:hypothetical protein GCM10010401_13810 [Rarobacter faecitabidus]|uniref:Uncharacterized protein n=1 Tax=Rarobacter faecitabidus TaxID=13243 RepID=A0A542ZE08_RARFA|nr:hypothetical protein FB461_1987 [Rarobacter faecitabidus]
MHVGDEVFFPVRDGDVLYWFDGFFAGPGDLAGGTVGVQESAAGSGPVAESFSGFGELVVPGEGCGAFGFGVVRAQPVQVQGGQFPDEFGVAVPERGDDGDGQPVGAAQPVDPFVQGEPFFFGGVGGEEVPVDRVRGSVWLIVLGDLAGVGVAMLLAVPYLLAASTFTTLISDGGPGWLNLLVLPCLWNMMKFIVIGPVSMILLGRAHLREEISARAERRTKTGSAELMA